MRRTFVVSLIIQTLGCSMLLSQNKADPPPPQAAAFGNPKKWHGEDKKGRYPTARCHHNKHAKVRENQELFVIDVKDGDTIHGCLMPEGRDLIKIRLKGIDCPESRYNKKCEREGRRGGMGCEKQIPLGQKAKRRAEKLMLNHTIKLESTRGHNYFEKDHYGRVLSYIRLENDEDFALEMIGDGYCRAYSFGRNHPRKRDYERAGRDSGVRW